MRESSLRRCRTDGRYTLRELCPTCGGPTRTAHPARYSPEDRWARYRRALYASEAANAPEVPSPGEAPEHPR
jgi:H/ACA ribonucleoprotein complex subunit 3